MIELAISFALGFATVFTPCVLPFLPVYAIQLYTKRLAHKLLGIGLGTFLALLIFGTLLSVASALLVARKYLILGIGALTLVFAVLLLKPEKLAFFYALDAKFSYVPSGIAGGFVTALLWIPCAFPLLLAAGGIMVQKPEYFPFVALLYSIGIVLGLFLVGAVIRLAEGKVRITYGEARYFLSALLGAYGIYLILTVL